MGRYMEAALTEQKNIGINLDSKTIISWVFKMPLIINLNYQMQN